MKNKDKEKNVTVLGKETAFTGVMKFTDILHIEGSFNGNIDATGFLYVAKGAVCEVGYINVASIVVEGTVRGSINATGDVELKQGATVVGDIVALRLKIDDDVSFHGAIRMLHSLPSIESDIFAMDASSFRKSLKNLSEKEYHSEQKVSTSGEELVTQEKSVITGGLLESTDDSEW